MNVEKTERKKPIATAEGFSDDEILISRNFDWNKRYFRNMRYDQNNFQ